MTQEHVLALRENLSAIAVPTRYFQLEDFPTSATGKLQKSKLRELLQGKPDVGGDGGRPP